MIQEFLNKQLILATEDANIEKLKKASAKVVQKISKDKTKISSYTLSALDPEISADDQNILEVKKIIIDSWSTFVANNKDTAVTIIRAVMLEALQVISKEKNSACIIWFAGRNVFKHFKLGREEELLTNFVLELGNRIESEAIETWSLSPNEIIEVPKLTAASIDKGLITSILKAAASSTSWNDGGENPYSQAQNDANWSKFFATKAGDGLTDAINQTLKKQISEISSGLPDFLYQNRLHQMRVQLLWWKEAGYSSSLNKSYRELKDAILQVVLALDYSFFIPVMYPKSVDYFLKATLNSLSSSDDKKFKISDFLKSLEKDGLELKTILPEFPEVQGRITLMNFLQGLVFGNYKANQFKIYVGIPDSTLLTYEELTLWLFHDLQSLKLTKIK